MPLQPELVEPVREILVHCLAASGFGIVVVENHDAADRQSRRNPLKANSNRFISVAIYMGNRHRSGQFQGILKQAFNKRHTPCIGFDAMSSKVGAYRRKQAFDIAVIGMPINAFGMTVRDRFVTLMDVWSVADPGRRRHSEHIIDFDLPFRGLRHNDCRAAQRASGFDYGACYATLFCIPDSPDKVSKGSSLKIRQPCRAHCPNRSMTVGGQPGNAPNIVLKPGHRATRRPLSPMCKRFVIMPKICRPIWKMRGDAQMSRDAERKGSCIARQPDSRSRLLLASKTLTGCCARTRKAMVPERWRLQSRQLCLRARRGSEQLLCRVFAGASAEMFLRERTSSSCSFE